MTMVVVRGPQEGEALVNPMGAKVLIRITGKETGGSYAMIEGEQLPGSAPAPLHIHTFEDEAIHVLEGRLIVEIDGVEHSALAGSYIFIPRGVAQRFWNPDDTICRYQSFFSPPGQEQYFREAYSLDPKHPNYQADLASSRAKYGLRYPGK